MTATSTANGPSRSPIHQVLHVADADVLARFGPMLGELLPALAARGTQVTLLTDDLRSAASLAATPVKCHLLPHLTFWGGWRLTHYLATQCKPPPDLIHLWGTAGLRWLRPWARRTRVPLVMHALGQKDVARLTHGTVRTNEQVILATDALAAGLLARCPTAVGRCHTLPPAVGLPPAPPPTPAEDHTFAAVCVVGPGDHAGVAILIQAVAQLYRQGSDLHLGLVGWGPGSSRIWRTIRECQAQDCVSLADGPGLWEKLLREIDACIVPSCQRELSIAPLLAMAYGKLVICSRDQLASWFIQDRTAWQFTPGSAAELAYLLARAIQQPGQAHTIGELASAYVQTRHALGTMIETLMAIYGQALQGRQVPPSPTDRPAV